jgi:hypothetical protein
MARKGLDAKSLETPQLTGVSEVVDKSATSLSTSTSTVESTALGDSESSVASLSTSTSTGLSNVESSMDSLSTSTSTVDSTELSDVDAPVWQSKEWLINNYTASMMAFPELGDQPASKVAAHASSVSVTFKSKEMYELFLSNIAQLALLNRWAGDFGVFLTEASINPVKED